MLIRSSVFLLFVVISSCASSPARNVAQHTERVCRQPTRFSEVETLTFRRDRDVGTVHNRGVINNVENLRDGMAYEVVVQSNVNEKHRDLLPGTISRKDDGAFHSATTDGSYRVTCYKLTEQCKVRGKDRCRERTTDKDITDCDLQRLSHFFTFGDICTETSDAVPTQQ
jgi:hypothetical protein